MPASVAAILAVAAWTDPSSVDPSTALVVGSARYEIVSGDRQSAPAGAELPAPLVVRVKGASGAPVPGQLVNRVITEGDGSVFGGRASTDDQGVAHEWWTLGATPGPNALEVRAVDIPHGHGVPTARHAAQRPQGVACALTAARRHGGAPPPTSV
jgi:hypothetical protein